MRALIEFLDLIAVWLYALGVLLILLYVRALFLALQDKKSAVHTMEREAATNRVYRAIAVMVVICLALGVLAFVDFVLGPAVARLPRDEEPQFWFFFARPTPVEVTPTPTLEHPLRPTVIIMPTPGETPSPTALPSYCPNPGVQITQPGSGATISGVVEIRGTAKIDNFVRYELGFTHGALPTQWAYIGGGEEPVEGGALLVWDASGLPAGDYLLRLRVVDNTGNYKDCQISIRLR
jgi:hypothetical protein